MKQMMARLLAKIYTNQAKTDVSLRKFEKK
jgi:hypothetical protein